MTKFFAQYAAANTPRMEHGAPEITKSPEDDAVHPVKTMRVLVAEDNFANQLIAKTLLLRAGHKVETANNGRDAIALSLENIYDLILMDIEMPGVNGIEATEYIRAHTGPNQHTRIIALTAYSSASQKYTYRQSGIDNVITKPLKINILEQILTSHSLPLPHEIQPANPVRQSPHTALSHLTNLPHLDVITLDTLLASAGKEDLRKIVKAYWRSAYALLSDMQSAHQVWDRDTLQKSAHALKGASVNIGLLQVGEISSHLQNTPPDLVTDYLDALDQSMAKSRKVLNHHILSHRR